MTTLKVAVCQTGLMRKDRDHIFPPHRSPERGSLSRGNQGAVLKTSNIFELQTVHVAVDLSRDRAVTWLPPFVVMSKLHGLSQWSSVTLQPLAGIEVHIQL
jgi:hypothetical protein